MILNFLHNMRLVSSEVVVDFLEKALEEPELRNYTMVAVPNVWEELTKRGKDAVGAGVVANMKMDASTSILKLKIEKFAGLPSPYPYEEFLESLVKRIEMIPPHLYFKATSMISDAPIRFLSGNPEFVRRVGEFVVAMRTSSAFVLFPRHELKFLHTIAQQRIATEIIPEIVSRVPLAAEKLRPIDTVRMISALVLAGKRFNETIDTLCLNILMKPEKFVRFTGEILSAFSDGNRQNEAMSAKVAEALVFSPAQSFSFSPSECGQVLMFCLRIGMDDNALIKRLLSLSPPQRVSHFDFKRYLLGLYYADRQSFGLREETEDYRKMLESNDWKVIQDLKRKPVHGFARGLYLPNWDEKKKKCNWTPSPMARVIYRENELLGDYLFYQKLGKTLAGCDLETTPLPS